MGAASTAGLAQSAGSSLECSSLDVRIELGAVCTDQRALEAPLDDNVALAGQVAGGRILCKHHQPDVDAVGAYTIFCPEGSPDEPHQYLLACATHSRGCCTRCLQRGLACAVLRSARPAVVRGMGLGRSGD